MYEKTKINVDCHQLEIKYKKRFPFGIKKKAND